MKESGMAAADNNQQRLADALSSLLSFMGQMHPAEFIDALYALKSPGLELCDRDELVSSLDAVMAQGWTALAVQSRETPSQQAASAAAHPNTTPLERVERAIADNITPELHDQIAFGYCARAALQALREVDEGTLEAMARTVGSMGDAGYSPAESMPAAFNAAIDHILSQTPNQGSER